MLKHLSIQNYALIERIDIDFPIGLSIVTGETGAGKSILLGALSLIAGNRADSSVLQDKEKKCIVEASFNIDDYQLKYFFLKNELDYSKITIVRREVSPEGKSRAFINDTPVNLSQLKELTLHLIDIHSQHETLRLNEASYQLGIIDSFSETTELVSKYIADYAGYTNCEKELSSLVEKEKQSKLDADYWQFQSDEFSEANLKTGEQDEVENELKVLNNSEEIKSILAKCAESLNGGELNLIALLSDIKKNIATISALNPAYADLLNRINSVYVELRDVAAEVSAEEEKTIYDPVRAESLSDRIDLIYKLQKKHQVNSIEDLLKVSRQISEKINDIFSLENSIKVKQQDLEKQRQKLFLLAKRISSDRQKCFPKFEKEVSGLLVALAMPNAQFKTEHTLLETLTEQGIDKIQFLFSANKGSALQAISKVASGGELSRLMLSIKAITAKIISLPTIIFDEIDTGVSGNVAEQVGKTIAEMSKKMQVITITHLPQIASKGNSHFSVYKEDKKNKTVTQIKALSKEERILEVASMLSTGKPTDASLKNAKELLKL